MGLKFFNGITGGRTLTGSLARCLYKAFFSDIHSIEPHPVAEYGRHQLLYLVHPTLLAKMLEKECFA